MILVLLTLRIWYDSSYDPTSNKLHQNRFFNTFDAKENRLWLLNQQVSNSIANIEIGDERKWVGLEKSRNIDTYY